MLVESGNESAPSVDVRRAQLVRRRLVVALLLHGFVVKPRRLLEVHHEVAGCWQPPGVEERPLNVPNVHAVAHDELAESEDVLVEVRACASDRLPRLRLLQGVLLHGRRKPQVH